MPTQRLQLPIILFMSENKGENVFKFSYLYNDVLFQSKTEQKKQRFSLIWNRKGNPDTKALKDNIQYFAL